jgi:hypothetical protein
MYQVKKKPALNGGCGLLSTVSTNWKSWEKFPKVNTFTFLTKEAVMPQEEAVTP